MRDTTHANYQRSDEALSDALRRVQSDFMEMPGLQLTQAQAARLWGFDAGLCDAVLKRLVETRFLVRVGGAAFVRSTGRP